MISVVVYPVTWVIMCITDVTTDSLSPMNVIYAVYVPPAGRNFLGLIGLGIADMNSSASLQGLNFISLVLPAFIATVCSLLQIFSILKPSEITVDKSKEKKMTMTILMLTTTCLLCNVPFTCFMFHTALVKVEPTLFLIQLAYVLGTLMPFINSAGISIVHISQAVEFPQFLEPTIINIMVFRNLGGGQRHFWHFLPVIPNFWQVPNFLRCQKCQTFKKVHRFYVQ